MVPLHRGEEIVKVDHKRERFTFLLAISQSTPAFLQLLISILSDMKLQKFIGRYSHYFRGTQFNLIPHYSCHSYVLPQF